MSNMFQRRIKRVCQALHDQGRTSALLLSPAACIPSSRDAFHPFRQSSDFYYLTGSLTQNGALLLSTRQKRPVLFEVPLNRSAVVWDGKPVRLSDMAEALQAEVVAGVDMEKEILSYLRQTECLIYQNEAQTLGWKIAQRLISTPSHLRSDFPRRFIHSDVVLEPLRAIKDAQEIESISHAATLTSLALRGSLPVLAAGNDELQVAATFDYLLKAHASEPAFPTIVAAGKEAATLHHSPCSSRRLRTSDMVLIDCGAKLNMYSADITRVFPVSGKFESWQLTLYNAVLEAQAAALGKIRHGSTVKQAYEAAALVLTHGLIELKVLRGRASSLCKRGAFRPFFPHGIGHGLGLDVHDIGNHRADKSAQYRAGMVVTVEPGLYFPKAVGHVKACGIRIEDDVLVTHSKPRILTGDFPKRPGQIEALLATSEN